MFDIFQKTCRTCLQNGSEGVSIDQCTSYSSPKVTYGEILKDIARLEFNDDQSSGMPQQLCLICCRQLRKTYMFVKQARESDEKLLKMLETQCELVTDFPNVTVETQIGVKKEDGNEIEFEQHTLRGGDPNLDTSSSPKLAFLEITLDNEKSVEIENSTWEQVNVPENTAYVYDDLENCNALEDKNEKEYNCRDLSANSSPTNVNHLERFVEGPDSVYESETKDKLTDTPDNLEINNACDELDLKSEQELSVDEVEELKTRKSLQYKCDHCPRQYSDRYNLRYHLIYKHQIDYKSIAPQKRKQRSREKVTIKCRSCDYTANTYAALNYHNRSKHGSEEDKFKCKFCAYSNLKKFSLLTHIKKFHLPKIKSLKKVKGTNKEAGGEINLQSSTEETTAVDENSEDQNANDTIDDDDSSACSSGDEEIIRDILNIKKRMPKSKVAESDELNEFEEVSKNSEPSEEITCTLCPKVVNSHESLLAHMQRHHTNESLGGTPTPETKQLSFVCDQCPRTYTEKSKFKTHIRDKHGIDFKDFVKKHHKISSERKVFKCKFCEYTANTAAAAHFHVRSKHGSEEDKFKCSFCVYSNFKKFSLLKHMKRAHLSAIKMLKTQRNSGTESIEDVINSIPKLQDPKSTADNNMPNECSEACSSGDEDFIRDILNMKKRGGKANITKTFAIRCDECGNVYKDSHALKVHHRNVHGEHTYKPCPQCHRKYKRNYDLKLHILHAHTPNYVDPKQPPKIREKRFMCTECSYICATSTLLTIHTNRHHTGEKPHKCEVCSKSFVVAFDLKTHSYLHTGERPFQCPVCSKGFRDKSHMLKHKRIHSEVKPYNCSDCGKGFTKNYNLTIHKRTHMKGQKLNCSVCGKFFKDRAQLNIHQINEFHHGEAV